MNPLLRVLVVDDSAYVRKVVKEMLLRSHDIAVVGLARDGREALELVEELKPDVVTCDHCHLRLDASEPRTTVGTAIFHRHPNCYLRKLYAIHH